MLKDYNHDLVHALSEKNDAVWRYHRENIKNSQGCESCVNLWKKLMDDDNAHIEMLKKEIAKHIKENRFD